MIFNSFIRCMITCQYDNVIVVSSEQLRLLDVIVSLLLSVVLLLYI